MKKAIIIGLAIGAVIFGEMNAFAAPYINKRRIVIDYVDIVNPYMTSLEKKQMLINVIAFQRASGIKVTLGARYNISDPFSSKRLDVSNTTSRFSEEFNYWKSKVSNLRKRWHVLYVVSPPWTIGNKLDASGWPNGGLLNFGGYAETGRVSGGCIANGSPDSEIATQVSIQQLYQFV